MTRAGASPESFIAAFALMVTGALPLHAGTGALDPTFGTAGSVSVPGYGIAVQADGKIVVLGAASISSQFPNFSETFTVRRLSASGSIEFASTPTVGTCGFCSAASGGTAAIALQADGRSVAAGTWQTSSLNTGACKSVSFVLLRHLSSGSPDSTFGTGGVARAGGGEARALAIQADGKIVVAGSKKNYGCLSADAPQDHGLSRLNVDGTRDLTFGLQGSVNTPLGTGEDMANALAIQPDGKIVVSGYASNGTNKDFSVARFSAAGVLEESALLDVGSGTDDVAYALRLQSDGMLLVGGSSGANSALVRLSAPGTYDPSFATGGKFLAAGAAISAIVLQPDAKIIVATADGDVLRLLSNGTLDTGFGIGGRLSLPLTAIHSLALQADGRLIVGGNAVVRVDSSAVLPITPDPASIDFEGQSLRTTSPSRLLTLTNTGSSTQTITSISVPAGFAVTHNCAVMAAGSACTASISFTPISEGAQDGTLVVTGSAGTQKILLSGIGEKSLVTHYYRSILRRAPDAGGKSFWNAEAARVQTLGVNVNEVWFAMAGAFYSSAEYLALNRDNAGFVTDLYTTFFNRAPDTAGFNDWTGQLAAGMPREVVLASFMFSTEFAAFTQAIFGSTSTRKEVDTVVDFYRGLLARLPDSGGFSFWLQLFRTAQCQGSAAVTTQAESISSQYALSAEYLARNRSNPQYVGDLYNAFLRRGGDLAGVQFWISQISTGARTRENVRQQFVASPEFQARVASIIAQGCLQ